ncbi:MAG: fibrobacter succinogenes major paralogous domain-containing protein [Bacteroidales bacterium]
MKKTFLFIIILSIYNIVAAQNHEPVVSNVRMVLRQDCSKIIDIYYDLADEDGDLCSVNVQASNDNGTTWDMDMALSNLLFYTKITGDIGTNITPGLDKHIIWDFSPTSSLWYDSVYRIKVLVNDIHFNSCPGTPTLTYGGTTYHTIQIGTQCWLKENLNIGTMILNNQASSDNGIIEKYCYMDDSNMCRVFGGIYKFAEMRQYAPNNNFKPQGICPEGWHIPDNADWRTLFLYFDPGIQFYTAWGHTWGNGNLSTDIGPDLREEGFYYWYPTSGYEGTNTSGFSLLAAGSKSSNSSLFPGFLGSAELWSGEVFDATRAFYFRVTTSLSIFANTTQNVYGMSVRCIRD